MTENGRQDIQWSPRVPKWKLRRLYELESQGIYDDELIDDIGWMLVMRCQDILRIHEARNGTVTCPRCANSGKITHIQRQSRARDEELCCPVCNWHLTWYTYSKSYKRKQLNPGGAVSAFRAYVRDFKRAQSPREKMLVIDRVIHAFHYSLRDQPDLPTRPAGVNLIVGKLTDVVQFLDELSGIENSPALQTTSTAWRSTFEETWWTDFLDVTLSQAENDP